MSEPTRFIRKNGRIIPISDPQGGGSRTSHAGAPPKKVAAQPTAHPGLKAAAFGLSAASGIIGAAGFQLGAKGIIAGEVASTALGGAATAATIASVSGRGFTKKEAAKQGAAQELANQALGWGLYIGGIAGTKRGRAAVVSGAKKGVEVAGKALTLARKALGAV